MNKKYFDQYTADPWSEKSTNVLKSGPYTYNEERGGLALVHKTSHTGYKLITTKTPDKLPL